MSFYAIGLEENLHFRKHKRLKNVYKMSIAVIRTKKYPGNTFVIMMYNLEILSKSLTILKKSLLWNHEGDFLIISNNIENGCQNVRSALELVWSYHILSATFLCYNKYESTKIYTFNPYTDFAPKFWSVSRQSTETKRNWTLFYRTLDSSLKNTCKSVQKLNLLLAI